MIVSNQRLYTKYPPNSNRDLALSRNGTRWLDSVSYSVFSRLVSFRDVLICSRPGTPDLSCRSEMQSSISLAAWLQHALVS